MRQQIASLERSLLRERKARKDAEDILRQKAMEAFETQRRLETATERLTLALRASREAVWEWDSKDDVFRLYNAISSDGVKIEKRGTFKEAIDVIHPDYQSNFIHAWTAHERLETKSFDMLIPRFSASNKAYRWARLRGQFTKRDEDGKAQHFLGLIKDAESSVLRNQTYQTIVDAFLNSSRPGFIINLKIMHIECNLLGYKVLGLNIDGGSADVTTRLPVDTILKSIKAGDRKFTANITNADGAEIPVGIYLSEVPDLNAETPHCVGFFATQAFPT